MKVLQFCVRQEYNCAGTLYGKCSYASRMPLYRYIIQMSAVLRHEFKQNSCYGNAFRIPAYPHEVLKHCDTGVPAPKSRHRNFFS